MFDRIRLHPQGLNFALLCLLVFFQFCTRTTNLDPVDAGTIINILNHDVSSVEDVFDEVDVVLLEQTDFSLISKVDQVKFHKERYYILDKKQRSLFVFDSKGNFIFSTASKIGKGPNELLYIQHFDISNKNDEIVLLDPLKRRFIHLNHDGDFVKDIFFPSEILPLSNFIINKDDTYLFYTSSEGGFENFGKTQIVLFDPKLDETKSINHIISKKDLLIRRSTGNPAFAKVGSEVYVTDRIHTNHYNILDLDENETFVKYSLHVQGEQIDALSNLKNDELTDEVVDMIQASSMFIRKLISKKHIFYTSYKPQSDVYVVGIFDRSSEEVILQVSNKFGLENILPPPDYVDENHYVHVHSSGAEQLHFFTLVDSAITSTVDRDFDNPIILKYHFE